MTFSAFLPFSVLVVAQLAGEALARVAGVPLPGTVVGAVLLFLAMLWVPGLHARVAPFSHALLRNMLLFYVPASAGIMKVFGDVARHGPLLVAIIVVGTWATALAAATAFDALRPSSAARAQPEPTTAPAP